MKKLLFALMLSIACFSVKAQNFNNNTSCAVKITPVCYDVNACTYTSCGTPTNVPGNSSVTLASLPTCSCKSNEKRGYVVCCTSTPTVCAYIGSPAGPYPCALFPGATTFPACGTCSAVNLAWGAGPNLNLN